MRDTRKRTRAPCASVYALPRAPAPMRSRVRVRVQVTTRPEMPLEAPRSPYTPFSTPPPCPLPSQPVKRLTEPPRRLYSRFPVFRVQCSTLHSVDPPTLCKMPNLEKLQKIA